METAAEAMCKLHLEKGDKKEKTESQKLYLCKNKNEKPPRRHLHVYKQRL